MPVSLIEQIPNNRNRIKNGDNVIYNLMDNISNIKSALHFKGPFRHIQRDVIEFSFYHNNEMSFCFLFCPEFSRHVSRDEINVVNV